MRSFFTGSSEWSLWIGTLWFKVQTFHFVMTSRMEDVVVPLSVDDDSNTSRLLLQPRWNKEASWQERLPLHSTASGVEYSTVSKWVRCLGQGYLLKVFRQPKPHWSWSIQLKFWRGYCVPTVCVWRGSWCLQYAISTSVMLPNAVVPSKECCCLLLL